MAAPYLSAYGRAAQQGPANFSGNGQDPNAEFRRTTAQAQPMLAGAAVPPQPIPPPGGADMARPAATPGIPPPTMPQSPSGLTAAPIPSGASRAPVTAQQPDPVQMGKTQAQMGPPPALPPPPANLTEAVDTLTGGRATQKQGNDTPSGTTYGNSGSTTTGGQGATVTNPATGQQSNPGNDAREWIGKQRTPGGGTVRDALDDAPQPPTPNDAMSEVDRLKAEIEALKNRGMNSAQDLANQIQNTTSQTFNPNMTFNMPDPTAGLRDMFSGAMGNVGNFNIGMFLNALGLGGLMGGGGGGGGGLGGMFGGFGGGGGGGGSPFGGGSQYGGGGQGGGGLNQSSNQTTNSRWGNRQTTTTGAQQGAGTRASQGGLSPGVAQDFAGRGAGMTTNPGGQSLQRAPGTQIPPPGSMRPMQPTNPSMGQVQGQPTAQGNLQASMPAQRPTSYGNSMTAAQPDMDRSRLMGGRGVDEMGRRLDQGYGFGGGGSIVGGGGGGVSTGAQMLAQSPGQGVQWSGGGLGSTFQRGDPSGPMATGSAGGVSGAGRLMGGGAPSGQVASADRMYADGNFKPQLEIPPTGPMVTGRLMGGGAPSGQVASADRMYADGNFRPQLEVPPPGLSNDVQQGNLQMDSVSQDSNGQYRVNRGGSSGGSGSGGGRDQNGQLNGGTKNADGSTTYSWGDMNGQGGSGGDGRGASPPGSPGQTQNNSSSPGGGWGGDGPTDAEQRRQSSANLNLQHRDPNWMAGNLAKDPLSSLSDLMTGTDIGRYQSWFDPFNTYNRAANNTLQSQIDDYGDNNIRMGQRAEDAARQSMMSGITSERNAQQRMLDARAARGGMSNTAAQNSIYQNAANAQAEGERGLAMDAYNREMGRLSGLGAARSNLANSLTQGNNLDYENLMSQYTSNKDSMNNLMGFLSSIGEIIPF